MITIILAKIAKKCPMLIWQLRHLKRYHSFMNVKKPRNLYEKIVQMSIYEKNESWSILADKFAVREEIKSIIGEKYLNELYGHYNSPDDIKLEELPNCFVLKTNNGCATNMIIKDKNNFDFKSAKKTLRKWLNFPYGELTGQLHYAKITPCIIAEKFLIQGNNEKGLIDYKFFCINGEPRYLFVYKDREINTHKFSVMAYDMNWEKCPNLVADNINHISKFEKPASFDEMKNIVTKLAKPYKFVRIDLYEINNRPIFGEYTFTPSIDALSPVCQENIFNEINN